MDEAGGRGQERRLGREGGEGRGVFGNSGRTSGGAEGPRGSAPPALIEVVVRDRFRLSGIEGGRLVEVVGEGFPGGLVVFRPVGPQAEFGLGWSSGGMKGRGRGGLTDVGEDLSNWLRIVG